MESTDVIDTVKVTAAEYRHLVDICTAADLYLRSGSNEALEELRDAVLMRSGMND